MGIGDGRTGGVGGMENWELGGEEVLVWDFFMITGIQQYILAHQKEDRGGGNTGSTVRLFHSTRYPSRPHLTFTSDPIKKATISNKLAP